VTTYAIGDVQGCEDSLQNLLVKINFNTENDRLWFAGDLVNRGPKSLQTLQYIESLGNKAKTVLGNHDLHALAVYYSDVPAKSKDTLGELLNSSDAPKLFDWLRHQPLAVYNADLDVFLSHAGIPPQWTIKQALNYAREVESVLQSGNANEFFANMYGNSPDVWSKQLRGNDRLRMITNYFTRMRFIDSSGKLDLKAKQGINGAPKGYDAWFNYPRKGKTKFVFGHWATLQGVTKKKRFVALDKGCVWGHSLRALALESGEMYEVSACD
jgi:bis(5'-nucleosyl)-tetraphosphatase (symmetrical)